MGHVYIWIYGGYYCDKYCSAYYMREHRILLQTVTFANSTVYKGTIFYLVPLVAALQPSFLPNKYYWLSPERREETFDRIAGHLLPSKRSFRLDTPKLCYPINYE